MPQLILDDLEPVETVRIRKTKNPKAKRRSKYATNSKRYKSSHREHPENTPNFGECIGLKLQDDGEWSYDD